MPASSEHVTATLAALSNVLLTEQTLEGLLNQIAALSVNLIDGSAGVGVTVVEHGRAATAAATADFVRAVDDAQYESGSGPCLEAADRGKPVAVADTAADGRWPHFALIARQHGIRSSLSLPLIAGDSTLGALNIYSRAVHSLGDAASQALAAAVAENAAIAVANAQAFDNERRSALILQRSLLPDHLPVLAGYELAVCYQPADTTASVGGDWYDVFQIPPGDLVGLVIGDVMGHGIESATVMGRLRTAVQAYAIEGAAPAQVLSNVDKLLTVIDEGPAERLATLCYAALTPGTGRVTMANGGHLPPILVDQNGTVTVVDGPTGPVLGATGAGWDEITVTLDQGSVMVFYTDGLIEDRQRPIDEGLVLLRKSLGDAGGDAAAICRRLYDDFLRDSAQEDDAAILVVRRLATDSPRSPAL